MTMTLPFTIEAPAALELPPSSGRASEARKSSKPVPKTAVSAAHWLSHIQIDARGTGTCMDGALLSSDCNAW
jgi:hypothetical protein